MNYSLTRDTIRKLSKNDLHYHLDGSIRPETIIDIAKKENVKLQTYDLDLLKKLVIVPDDCKDLVQFLEAFDITLSVLQSPQSLERAMFEVCEDSVQDGIKYLEIRFSPILHVQRGMDSEQVLRTVCGVLPKIESKLPIIPRIIVCGMKQMSPKISKELAELSVKYKDKGVVAFDMAGPEVGYSIKGHKEAYDIILKAGLKSTCHAGESDGPLSVEDAIENGRVNRIGHGIRSIEEKSTMEKVKEKGIVLEVCLTSNVKTKAAPSFQLHPIDSLYKNGVEIVPCTDDKLMCETTLTEEYFLLHTKKNFDLHHLLHFMDNSFKYSFLSDPLLKKQLRSNAFSSNLKILGDQGFPLESIKTNPIIQKIREEINC